MIGFNGTDVEGVNHLERLIRECKIDDVVKVKIIRDGAKEMEMDVRLQSD